MNRPKAWTRRPFADTRTDGNRSRPRIQFRRFLDFRDEALFLDTRFGGLDPGCRFEATRPVTTRAGLGVFGVAASGDEDRTLAALPPSLSPQQRDEVAGGFYELLLILADAVSQSPGAEPRQRADEALRIVNQAEGLRSPATRAYHLRRSAYLDMKGDSDEAARERDEAERLAPADAFDFFLIGRELTRRKDWAAAIKYFDQATQAQPEHFWAQCLRAVCHLQTQEPSKARLGLNACLPQKPDSVWLYLLRGIANAGEGKLARDTALRYPDQAASLSAVASKQFEDAEADYANALMLLRNKTQDAELNYVLLVNRGHIRLERQDLTAAAADLQEAIRLNDRRFEAVQRTGPCPASGKAGRTRR